MTVLTVTGMMGAGSPQLADELARLTGMDIVDRLALSKAAERLGTTTEEVESKTDRLPTLRERMAQSVRRAMLHQDAHFDAGDGGIEVLSGEEYRYIALGLDPAAAEIRDAVEAAIRDMARAGNVILSGRAAHMALRGDPSVVHVTVRSGLARRIERVMERLGSSREDAEKYIGENDRARAHYYKSFYGVDPEDPSLFHLVLNTDHLSVHEAANIVIAASKEVAARSTPLLNEHPSSPHAP